MKRPLPRGFYLNFDERQKLYIALRPYTLGAHNLSHYTRAAAAAVLCRFISRVQPLARASQTMKNI